MNNRRSFLFGMAVTSISQLMGGCMDSQKDLMVLFLQNSLPSELIGKFQKTIKNSTSFKAAAQLQDIYKSINQKEDKHLLSNNFKDLSPDLVTLGDYYLGEFINNKLIEPLSIEKTPNWHKLPSKFQQLVRRNSQGFTDPNGSLWAAPYRWGMTVIAYDQNKLKSAGISPPIDWSDLWQPQYRGHLKLINLPREIIGLTLKKLGYSYNTKDLNQVKDLQNTLDQLQQNVKFYSSNDYLQSLIFGDSSIVVGWSNELISLQSNYPNIKVVIPKSGTSLWTDLWVKPAKSKNHSSLINQWIDFCWQEKSAKEISLFTSASSPMLYSLEKKSLPPDILNNSLIYVDQALFNKCEFLEPLPQETLKTYESFWRKMRSQKQ
jgi:putative spermidine/putrescine transport system substrate-binding protein